MVTGRDSSQLLEQEQWLRTNGLPLVVPPGRRLRGLIPRTVPLLVTFASCAIGLVIIDALVSNNEALLFNAETLPADQLWALLGGLVMFVAAIPLGLAYAWLQRKMGPVARIVVGSLIIVFWLGGLSALALVTHARWGLHIDIVTRVGLLLLAALIGFFGIGDMARWAGKRGARELAATLPAIARILPLLLLTVLLVFFTNELWQLAGTMTKTRMWMLAAFLILMIVVIVLPSTLDMIDEDDDDDREGLLISTPFQGVESAKTRLSMGEHFNLLAVSITVQFVQILMFVVATFAVFALIGGISITDTLIATWTGEQARPLVVLGLRLPIEAHMFRVCTILALFSGISFAASTLQDKLYRTLFLDRVSEDVQRNLAARHRYRATLVAEGQAPHRWLGLADD